jgi:hypothetical protein
MGKNKPKTKEEKEFEDYKSNFKSEDDRIGHSVTMVLTFAIGIYFMFNVKKFLRLFYTPGVPLWQNMLQFCSLLACCWLFGLFLSKSIAFSLKLSRKIRNKK